MGLRRIGEGARERQGACERAVRQSHAYNIVAEMKPYLSGVCGSEAGTKEKC